MKRGTRGKWRKEIAMAKVLNALANNGERMVVALAACQRWIWACLRSIENSSTNSGYKAS